jgi:AraC-like DNA-binding protein
VLVLVVHTEALRALAVHACAHVGLVPRLVDVPSEPRTGARALVAALGATPAPVAGLLVHDFAPDPPASMRWLDAAAAALPALRVLALLGAPAGAALQLLVGHPHRFSCVDVVLARESSARALGERLVGAARGAQQAAAVRALASGWPLDPCLAMLADRAFAMAGAARGDRVGGAAGWPTVDALLREAAVSRGTFVRHAARAGFRPPLRFLQVLRVLGVAGAVHAGETAAAAAVRFGYGSADTLRHHFARLTGLTPRDARHVAPDELVARMRGGA